MIQGNVKVEAPKIFLGPHDVEIVAINPSSLDQISEFNLSTLPNYNIKGKDCDAAGNSIEVDTIRFVVFGIAHTADGPQKVSDTFFVNLVDNKVSSKGNMEFVNHSMQTGWFKSEDEAKLGRFYEDDAGKPVYMMNASDTVYRTLKGEAAFSAFLSKWLGIRPRNAGLDFALRAYKSSPTDTPRNVIEEAISGDFSFFHDLVDYANSRDAKVNLVLCENKGYQGFITRKSEAFGFGGFKNKDFIKAVKQQQKEQYAFSKNVYTMSPELYDPNKEYVNPCSVEDVSDDLDDTAGALGIF